MNLLFYIIFLHSYFKGILSFLSKEEIKISLDLIRELEIRQCVLVGNVKKEDLISDFKEFSSANIPVTHLTYSSSVIYIDSITNIYYRSGLIFKEENLDVLEAISQAFEKEKSIAVGNIGNSLKFSVKTSKTYKLGHFVWLIFLKNTTQNHQFDRLNVPYDCEFIVIQSENETAYKFTEIYTVKNKSFSLRFGTWDRNYGLQVPNVSFYCRRSNFQETEMRLVHSHLQLYDRQFSTYMQICDMVERLGDMMNLTFRFGIKVLHEDAFVDVIQSGDMLMYPYSFTFDDVNVRDIVGPTSKTIFHWYIKYQRVGLRSDYYLQPFDKFLWLILLIVIAFGTVLAIITQNWIKHKKRNLVDNLFLGLESFCNQCGNDDIETTSLRIICLCLRLIAISSILFYGATVTSFLAVEIFQPAFTNFEGFLSNGEYKIIFTDNDSLQNFFRFNSIMNNRIINRSFTKVVEVDSKLIPETICHEKYVVVQQNHVIDYFKMPCNIYRIPEYFGSVWLGLTLKRNSAFTRILNKNLIRFYEIGFQMRYRTMLDKSKWETMEEDSFRPIKMEQMAQVLSIPVIGILLGIAILVIEIINKRRGLIIKTRNLHWKKIIRCGNSDRRTKWCRKT